MYIENTVQIICFVFLKKGAFCYSFSERLSSFPELHVPMLSYGIPVQMQVSF